MKIHTRQSYAEQRRREYPPLEQLADALVHEAAGNPEPKRAYLAACAEVKCQFPKPAATPVRKSTKKAKP